MKQGEKEWFEARRGKPTSSRFKDVKKDRSGKWTKTALSYAYELLAARNTKEIESISAPALEHGTYYEDEARRLYEIKTSTIVREVGFIEYKFTGSSPDGLCGQDGVLEVKCPFAGKRHQETLCTRQVPEEYIPQIQGNMMVTGRAWCDYVSFNPNFIDGKEIIIIRVNRDQNYINKLEQTLMEFNDLLNTME